MKHNFETCRRKFQFIGQGTGRAVFDFDGERVIKVPHVVGGYDQNLCEIEVFKKYGDKIPLTRIDLELSNKHQIVAEKVRELPDSFDTSYDFDTELFLFSLIETQSIRIEFVQKWQHKNVLIFNFLKSFLKLTQEETSNILFDVCTFNMGIRKTAAGQELVILDYGYSEEYSNNRPQNYAKELHFAIIQD